jgi:hypothetical protein
MCSLIAQVPLMKLAQVPLMKLTQVPLMKLAQEYKYNTSTFTKTKHETNKTNKNKY